MPSLLHFVVVVVVVTPPTACLKLLRLAACVCAYVCACVVLYNTFVGRFEQKFSLKRCST